MSQNVKVWPDRVWVSTVMACRSKATLINASPPWNQCLRLYLLNPSLQYKLQLYDYRCTHGYQLLVTGEKSLWLMGSNYRFYRYRKKKKNQLLVSFHVRKSSESLVLIPKRYHRITACLQSLVLYYITVPRVKKQKYHKLFTPSAQFVDKISSFHQFTGGTGENNC